MPESAARQFARLQTLTNQEAVDYLKGRGQLTQTFSWQDLWHEDHGQQFTVSRLARLDLLKAMQDGINQSVDGVLDRRDWLRDIKALLKKEGWLGEVPVLDPVTGEVVTTKFDSARLKLIFDTNTRMAYSAGQWERAWRNRESHPYIRYITKGDERVRATHRAWNNLTLPVDHPFWATHWPPNAWRCRCRVVSLTQAEYDKRRAAGTIETEAPPEQLIEWTNRRTGEVSQVPAGISPGFDYNPGLAKTRRDGLQKVGLDKLDNLPAPIRRAAMTPTIGEGVSEDFSQAVVGAHAALPANARRALAAAGFEVRTVSRIVEELPDLAGKRPTGYPDGFDYRHVDGLVVSDRKLLLVAEQCIDPETGQWGASSVERGKGVLRHETGHVMDIVHELLNDPDIAEAWRREAAALKSWRTAADVKTAREIDYFTQKFPDSALEVVAELFAIRHGGGTASQIEVTAAFPDTMARLNRALADKGL